jgi:hypothetical protein
VTPKIIRKAPGWVISDETAAFAVLTYAEAYDLYRKVIAMNRRPDVGTQLFESGDGPDGVGTGALGR